MPDMDFTLPHWAYWIGLVLFPVVAIILARRSQPDQATYRLGLGYLILIAGGMIGLHRFYLKNLFGLLFIPVFLAILFANGQERSARSELSDAQNVQRRAQQVLERETSRVANAEAELPSLRAALMDVEAGSFRERRVRRQLERAENSIATGNKRIVEAETVLVEARPRTERAAGNRSFWKNAANLAFYTILAMIAVDAMLLPWLVKRARLAVANARSEASMVDLETATHIGETDPDARKSDHEYVENWIDRLSLWSGEFVSYWAVIAVFVYYYEVIVRYVFNAPTNWAHEAMYLMFGMQYLIAGSYAMLTESHVRVDVFYAPMPRLGKAWTDLATSVFFFIFAGTLLVTSYIFAMDAITVPAGNSVVSDWARGEIGFFRMLADLTVGDLTDPGIRWGEISFNEWEVPLWPMKWMMVAGAILLILQGISKLGKDIQAITRGN